MSDSLFLVSGFDERSCGHSLTLVGDRLCPGPTWAAGAGCTYLCAFIDASGRRFVVTANRDVSLGGAASACCLSLEVVAGVVAVRAVSPSVNAAGVNSCHVSVHPSGMWVAVSNWVSGTLALLPRGADGSLGAAACVLAPGANTHQCVWAAGGTRAIVPVMGADRVLVYTFDASTGVLTLLRTWDAPPGSGPRHVVLNGDESCLYLISEMACSVTSLAFVATSGELSPLCTVSALHDGAVLNMGGERGPPKAAAIVLTNDGRYVYAGIRGGDGCRDGVAAFSVSNDGRLKSVGFFDGTEPGAAWPPLRVPRDMCLSPASTHLLVASQANDTVHCFQVVSSSGVLVVTDALRLPGAKPTCIKAVL